MRAIGYFGVPGGYGGIVHVVEDGKPACGVRMGPEQEFQWCAPAREYNYVECRRCKAWVHRHYSLLAEG